MIWGGHLFAWGLAAVCLVFACIAMTALRKGKRWRRSGILAVIIALALVVNGWVVLSSETATQFTAIASSGEFDKANQMLNDVQWSVGDDGTVTIRAEDGSSVVIQPDELPLEIATDEDGVPIPHLSFSQIVRAKRDFAIRSKGKCVVFCSARQGTVRCIRIEISP